MPVRSSIEQYLESIAQGEGSSVAELLPQLSNAILYAPVLRFEELKDTRKTKRIKVATFASGSRRVVPVFTSEDYFLDWSAGRHKCFSVPGADLALTLPKDAWLVLNPGKLHALELSPDDVQTMSESFDEDASLADSNPQRKSQNESGKPLGDHPAIVELRREHREQIETASAGFDAEAFERIVDPKHNSEIAEPKHAEVDAVLSALFKILSRYAEVREGYFQEGGSGQAVLGLFTTELDAEQRFLLIDEIAELSRESYGTAGAIEVYDDLVLRTSHSWDLFNAITPFYCREEGNTERLVVEKERIQNDATGSVLGGLRRQSGRLLGFLRGGRED